MVTEMQQVGMGGQIRSWRVEYVPQEQITSCATRETLVLVALQAEMTFVRKLQ